LHALFQHQDLAARGSTDLEIAMERLIARGRIAWPQSPPKPIQNSTRRAFDR
jgi:hypothetical protein